MPNFKKIRGKIFGVQLSKAEQEALTTEINRQLAEYYDSFMQELDAMILWSLHTQLGFGKKRLERFYKQFSKQHLELMKYYELDGDSGRLCKYKLKDLGIDLDEWQKELEEENDSSNLS